MLVLMVRHSIAQDFSEGGDFGRELTEEGRKRFLTIMRFLAATDLTVDTVLHSPRKRAVQTADLLIESFGVLESSRSSIAWLGEEYLLDDLLGTLRGVAGPTVAVVAHEPFLTQHAGKMIGEARLHMAPGSVAAISFDDDDLAPGVGRLEWLIDARLFNEQEG